MAEGKAGVYPIGVVKRLTGLTERQIRYYDEKGLISPQRTKGNQRLYTPADVDKLLEIKRLLERGLNIEEIRGVFQRREAKTPQEHGALEYEDARSFFRLGKSQLGLPSQRVVSPERTALARTGTKLRSVYPVSNRAELLKALNEMKEDDS